MDDVTVATFGYDALLAVEQNGYNELKSNKKMNNPPTLNISGIFIGISQW